MPLSKISPIAPASVADCSVAFVRLAKHNAVFVTLLDQDSRQKPATGKDAEAWVATYGLKNAYVCANPKAAFAIDGGYPTNYVVDGPTKQIVQSTDGENGWGDTVTVAKTHE